MQRLEQSYHRVCEKKDSKLVSTGIRWSDELYHNLFILAVSNPNQFIPQLFNQELMTIEEGVAALRLDKSTFDSR